MKVKSRRTKTFFKKKSDKARLIRCLKSLRYLHRSCTNQAFRDCIQAAYQDLNTVLRFCPKNLTTQDKIKISLLYREGVKIAEIARRMGTGHRTVNYVIAQLGLGRQKARTATEKAVGEFSGTQAR